MFFVVVFFFTFPRQDVESENVNVVKRLFKIQNVNASTIRTVMVAHCRRHDNPDLLLDYEAQSQARRQKGQQQQQHRPLLFDLGTSGSEEDEDEETGGEEARLPAHRFPQPSMSGLGHVLQVSYMERSRSPDAFLKNVILLFNQPLYSASLPSR